MVSGDLGGQKAFAQITNASLLSCGNAQASLRYPSCKEGYCTSSSHARGGYRKRVSTKGVSMIRAISGNFP